MNSRIIKAINSIVRLEGNKVENIEASFLFAIDDADVLLNRNEFWSLDKIPIETWNVKIQIYNSIFFNCSQNLNFKESDVLLSNSSFDQFLNHTMIIKWGKTDFKECSFSNSFNGLEF